MAENNQKTLEAIQRLRMGINKGKTENAGSPQPKTVSAPIIIEDFKMLSFDDIETPNKSIEEMFAQIINSEKTQQKDAGVSMAEMQETENTGEADHQDASMQAASIALLEQMSETQQKNWQKLSNFIDDWLADNS